MMGTGTDSVALDELFELACFDAPQAPYLEVW